MGAGEESLDCLRLHPFILLDEPQDFFAAYVDPESSQLTLASISTCDKLGIGIGTGVGIGLGHLTAPSPQIRLLSASPVYGAAWQVLLPSFELNARIVKPRFRGSPLFGSPGCTGTAK